MKRPKTYITNRNLEYIDQNGEQQFIALQNINKARHFQSRIKLWPLRAILGVLIIILSAYSFFYVISEMQFGFGHYNGDSRVPLMMFFSTIFLFLLGSVIVYKGTSKN